MCLRPHCVIMCDLPFLNMQLYFLNWSPFCPISIRSMLYSLFLHAFDILWCVPSVLPMLCISEYCIIHDMKYSMYTWNPFVLCFASKRRSFPIKTRDIWVNLGSRYTYISSICVWMFHLYYMLPCGQLPVTVANAKDVIILVATVNWEGDHTQSVCKVSPLLILPVKVSFTLLVVSPTWDDCACLNA